MTRKDMALMTRTKRPIAESGKRKGTGIRIDEALLEQIKVLSEATGRSQNNLIEHLLRNAVREYTEAMKKNPWI
jgi:hypothetical protein